MLGVFWEFESAMIRDPVPVGLDRTHAQGIFRGGPLMEADLGDPRAAYHQLW